MNPVYLVWNARGHDYSGEEKAAGDEKGGGDLWVCEDKETAVKAARERFEDGGVSQLVVELRADGRRQVVLFVGELAATELEPAGDVERWIARQAGRAIAAVAKAYSKYFHKRE